MADKRALVLDIDGTFLRTDMLFETFWAGLARAPLSVLALVLAHFREPSVLKAKLARLIELPVERLPVNEDIKTMAIEARKAGHEVAFASASDISQVQRLADYHGLADRVFASSEGNNLKGARKAEALESEYGPYGFDYAGDAAADRPVWMKAGVAVMVGARPAIKSALASAGREVVEVPGGWSFKDLLRALRPHQWVKNVLLFVPMIAAHAFQMSTLVWVLLGMASFSFAASSIYIVNDLLDLDADRRHPTKCRRPFASGAVPIQTGMVTCLVLGVLALGLGALINWAFLAVVAFYMLLSLTYSLKLKRMRWVDIATLASLYTIRVIAGGLASGVALSGFLIVFIFPVFLSLGCVKRLTELTLATSDERLPGRGYGRPDRGDLLNVAGLGTVAALLSFFLYSFTEQAHMLYPTQWLLWVALVPIAAWMVRMVLLGDAGKQDYDPIIFAMRDRFGIGLLLITLALMFYGAGLWAEWFGV